MLRGLLFRCLIPTARHLSGVGGNAIDNQLMEFASGPLMATSESLTRFVYTRLVHPSQVGRNRDNIRLSPTAVEFNENCHEGEDHTVTVSEVDLCLRLETAEQVFIHSCPLKSRGYSFN